MTENERISISRYIEEKGTSFYNLTVQQDLEGIVAKRKESKYFIGTHTKDWVKIKNLKDDDFIVCGYVDKGEPMISLILGQYKGNKLIYRGHVLIGRSQEAFQRIATHPRSGFPILNNLSGNDNAIWLVPDLVCVVKYMKRIGSDKPRQPVFKGLRLDKLPEGCVAKEVKFDEK